MRCGFIGLGSLGAPIARRIINAGYRVSLWDTRRESLAEFSGTSAVIASGVEQLGAEADHVGICVVDGIQVQEVCSQLFQTMPAGGRIAVHSTIHPDTCVALAGQASARGITLIDAPVSGGVPAAAAGKLTVMVGAERSALEVARPIFETFGSPVVYLGGVGAGQLAKLINNALMATDFALAHHAISTGVALGLGRAELIKAIKASSGCSFGFEVYAREDEAPNSQWFRKLLAKDMSLLEQIAASYPSGRALLDAAGSFFDFNIQDKMS